MMKKLYANSLVLVGYLQMLTMNGLANALPINGKTTGALSDQYANLFTPQGSTFSIWGLIYLLLLGYSIYNFWIPVSPKSKTINRLFLINTFLNSAWILAWHYEFLLLSVLVMFGLLGTLIKINALATAPSEKPTPLGVRLPFAVYFGWITIATIANITALLVGYDWKGFGGSEATWTLLVLWVGIGIGILQFWKLKQIPYLLVVIWAYWGIYAKHRSAAGFDSKYPLIIQNLEGCLGVLSLCLVVYLWINYFRLKKTKLNPA